MTIRRDSIPKYISMLYRSGSSYISKRLSKYNIGSGQHTFLAYLYHHDGVTQEQLSNDLYIDKSTTAKALKKLENEGYILRKVDEKDRRAYRVYLTDKGQAIIGDLFSILDEWNDTITKDFSEEEKELSIKLLQRMVENKNNFYRLGEEKHNG
jgi:DNA-binding MarR family transcriptional regulator